MKTEQKTKEASKASVILITMLTLLSTIMLITLAEKNRQMKILDLKRVKPPKIAKEIDMAKIIPKRYDSKIPISKIASQKGRPALGPLARNANNGAY